MPLPVVPRFSCWAATNAAPSAAQTMASPFPFPQAKLKRSDTKY